MNVFIDTNVCRSFYHFTSDDLEELRKLAVLIRNKRLVLYLPEQVRTEFDRNRDAKLADALKRFEEEKLPSAFPQMCKEYEEYSALRRQIDTYKAIKGVLLEKLLTRYRIKLAQGR
jgi:hypothetical protein